MCAEAALQAGVSRLVLASSVQVITGLTSTADVAARPKPNLPARPWATLTAPRVGPTQPAARGDWVPKHAGRTGTLADAFFQRRSAASGRDLALGVPRFSRVYR